MNEFVGKWRITYMEQWSQDMVDIVGEGYFSFDADDQGIKAFLFPNIHRCFRFIGLNNEVLFFNTKLHDYSQDNN
jgi:hypothetical protein